MAASMLRRCVLDLSHSDNFHVLLLQKARLIAPQKQFKSTKANDDPLDGEDQQPELGDIHSLRLYEADEDEIQKLRDVSRLPPHLKRRLDGKPPEMVYDFMQSTRYKRKIYGKFGSDSGVNPETLWPSKAELQQRKEDEHFFETPLQEMFDTLEKQKEKQRNDLIKKEARIEHNMSQMGKWIEGYRRKLEMEKEKAHQRQQKKKILLDEAREKFGYHLNTKDPKFQEMIQEKEESERKAAKERKKQKQADHRAAQIKAAMED